MYYRENKYGEKIEVERYECGSCAFYDFEREDETNKCSHYERYFSYRDSCKNYWEMASDVHESGTGCFLTTACCEYKGLPDDCKELTTMRKFRDEILSQSVSGNALIEYYYKIAPEIVNEIKCHVNREEILSKIYEEILKIVSLIEVHENDKAISSYVLLVYHVDAMVRKDKDIV